MAAKPKKIQQKGKGLGADDDIYEVRLGYKGHRERRRVGGDWGKYTHMATTDKGQKECDLFWSKLQTEEKRPKNCSLKAPTYEQKTERG